MAFDFNNNTPKKIDLKFLTNLQNVLNVARLRFNGVTVWLQRILYTITGVPPLTANKSFGEPLENYKIYGNSEQDGTPTPETPIEIQSIGEYFSPSGLPSGYEEVEYLESTGTQYIDTGIKGTQNTRFVIDFTPTSITSKIRQLFGDVTDTSKGMSFSLGWSSNAVSRFGDQSTTGLTRRYLTEDVRTLFDLSNNGYIINGTNVWTPNSVNFETVNSVRILFFNYNESTSSTPAIGLLYSVKIYESNVLIRNYVPCYRKSDNKPGMYDTVNNVFYTNEGEDEFIVGPSAMKYKIPVKVNTTVTNIYLDEPLRKAGNYADYIDFANQKVYRNVIVNDNTGTKTIEESYQGTIDNIGTTIDLPEILTNEGNNTIEVLTEVQPSNMEVKYYGTKF